MIPDRNALNQIATTLAKHFDSLYYVDMETDEYIAFEPLKLISGVEPYRKGRDFFEVSIKAAEKFVAKEDIERLHDFQSKKNVERVLAEHDSYSVNYRLKIGNDILHVRCINIKCEDKKHVLFCLENVDAEYRAKEAEKQDLQSAQQMARRDELTGIKNKNAFTEQSALIDETIANEEGDHIFGLVVCDVNDLKKINDTRGHSFGDEALQRASRMICEVFKHSPTYRIGGDEFAVILTGYDLENRDYLLGRLREESIANGKARSGPVVASGLAVFEPGQDTCFGDVFKRADALMYVNKNELKQAKVMDDFKNMEFLSAPITAERRRLLDGMFGALYTVAGSGYIYINDMKYDYSRWALSLVDDFGLESEYMYHADRIWHDYIHPDDVEAYEEAIKHVFSNIADFVPLKYRAKKADGTYVWLTTRGFVLTDNEGNPEYFGGIMLQVEE